MKLTSATKSLIDMDDGSSSSDPSGGNAFNQSSPDSPHTLSPHDALSNLMNSAHTYDRLTIKSENTAQKAKENLNRENLARQSTRNWKPGDIYAPHDLSPQEMVKWKQPKQPRKDIIDMLGLNPLDHYRVRRLPLCVSRLVFRSRMDRFKRVDGFAPARASLKSSLHAVLSLSYADPASRISRSWQSS